MNINQSRLALITSPNIPKWTGEVTGYDNSTYELTTSTVSGSLPPDISNLLLVREGMELVRIRDAAGATLSLAENPVQFANGDQLAIYDIRLPWPRYQRINDNIVYKDFDIAFPTPWQRQLPPTPIIKARIGTNDWLEAIHCQAGDIIDLDASDSFGNLDDADPLVFSWDAGAGGSIAGSGSTVTATYTTEGFRYLKLIVSDAHGTTANRYLPIWIGDANILTSVTQCSSRWSKQNGWSTSLGIESATNLTQYTPAAIIDIETSEVIFFGFIVPNSRTETFENITTSLALQSPLAFSKYLHSYPFLVTEIAGTETPAEWAELYEPTLSRVLWFLLYWHSTLPEVANCNIENAPVRSIAGQEFTLGSLPQQVDAVLKSAFWCARGHRTGGFSVLQDPLYLDESSWGALPGVDLSDTLNLREQIDLTYAEPTINQVRFGGVFQDTGGTFEPALAQAPATPGPWGSPSEVNNLAPANSSELEMWTSRHIAIANTANEYSVKPGFAIDPAAYRVADLPDSIRISIESASLTFNPQQLFWQITLRGKSYGRDVGAVAVPIPPETEYPSPPPPSYEPPIWDSIPDDSPIYYVYAASTKGLFRADDFPFLTSEQPIWTKVGGDLYITACSFNPDNPQDLQLAIAENTPEDQTTASCYLRRPSISDAWHEIMTMSEALTLTGLSPSGNEKFRYASYDPLTNKIYVTWEGDITALKFLFISSDFGETWSLTNTGATYRIGYVSTDTAGNIFLECCDSLGAKGQIWASDDHGSTFSTEFKGRSGNWMPYSFLDRTTDTLYAGRFTASDDYQLISSAIAYGDIDNPTYPAGVIDLTDGAIWAKGDFICAARYSIFYRTTTGGTTWGSVGLSPVANRALSGIEIEDDIKIVIARYDTIVSDPHLVFLTDSTGLLVVKSGNHPYETDGGGDSIPYNAKIADRGIAIGVVT